MHRKIYRSTDKRGIAVAATGWKILRPDSALDLVHARAVWQAMSEAVRQHGRILLDLSATTQIDSAGLASIAHAYELARHERKTLCLAGANWQVQRMLALCQLDLVLDMYATVTEATDASRLHNEAAHLLSQRGGAVPYAWHAECCYTSPRSVIRD